MLFCLKRENLLERHIAYNKHDTGYVGEGRATPKITLPHRPPLVCEKVNFIQIVTSNKKSRTQQKKSNGGRQKGESTHARSLVALPAASLVPCTSRWFRNSYWEQCQELSWHHDLRSLASC